MSDEQYDPPQEEPLLDEEPPQQEGPGLFGDGEPIPGTPAADEQPAAQHAAQPAARADRPEMPLALYRRYRPDVFSEVIGQEHVTEPLRRALINNKVNHAYLFSGPRGCGKTTSARILARALNCEQGPTPTPCGECDSCRELARGGGGSMDVIEIDAASHGGVDDARELRERAFFSPVNSRYKIYIVDEAHMVSAAGFNALLKLVEEPPPHVKFIFATTEPEKVIGTIRSRTHHYPFRLVPPKVLTGYLSELCEREGVNVEQAVLPLVVRAGAGSVRDSLSVLDQLLGGAAEGGVSYQQASALLGFTPESLLDDIMDALAAGDAGGVFATIDKIIEVGQDPRRFAEDLLRRLRDLVIVNAVPDAVESGLLADVPADQSERLRSQAAGLGSGELTRAAEVIAEGLTEMRGTTAPRLHLELMCARVLLPGADVDGRGVHARLDALERRLGLGGAGEIVTQAPSRSRASYEDRPAQPAADTAVPSTTSESTSGSYDSTSTPMAEGKPEGQQSEAPAGDESQRSSGPLTSQRPARQRPHVQRPPASPPVDREVPSNRPTVPKDQQGRPGADPAAFSTADMRRFWPQILDEVKARRRFAWMLLSQNTKVLDVHDGRLVLGFANQGARDHFLSGGIDQLLRQAMVSVIAASLQVEAVLDGADAPPTPTQQVPPRASSTRTPDDLPANVQRIRPLQQVRPDDAGGSTGGLAPTESSEAASSPRRAPAPRPRPDPLSTDARNEPDDSVSDDDAPLDEDPQSAGELIASELGAEIIEDDSE